MLAKLRRRLTYANVMSTIAVFVAVSTGGAYAANTIFSTDIVDGEVKTPDLASGAVATNKLAGGAVTTDRVKDNNLGGRDVLDNSLKGADIDESTLTAIGGGGPAGGDLTGTYPNPLIAPDAVGEDEIAPEAVTPSEIRVGAVGWADLANIIRVQESVSVPPNGGVGSVTAECDDSRERIISGGAHFAFPSGDISVSRRGVNDWIAAGQNNGNVAQDLTADAYCLQLGSDF